MDSCRIMQPEWHLCGAISMSKERKSNKEAKKKPALTPKERKAAKRAKKDAPGLGVK